MYVDMASLNCPLEQVLVLILRFLLLVGAMCRFLFENSSTNLSLSSFRFLLHAFKFRSISFEASENTKVYRDYHAPSTEMSDLTEYFCK